MSDSYIIEFYHIGKTVKVSAIDPATQTEVSIVGHKDASNAYLKQLAVQKLEYVLEKED